MVDLNIHTITDYTKQHFIFGAYILYFNVELMTYLMAMHTSL